MAPCFRFYSLCFISLIAFYLSPPEIGKAEMAAKDQPRIEWRGAKIETHRHAVGPYIELLDVGVWSWSPNVRFFNNDIVLLEGVELKHAEEIMKSLRYSGETWPREFKGIYAYDIKNNRFAKLTSYQDFSFNYGTRDFTLLRDDYSRVSVKAEKLEDIADESKYISYDEYIKSSKQRLFDIEEKLGRKGLTLLPNGDGYDEIFRTRYVKLARIYDLQGRLILDLSDFPVGTTRYAHWKNAYYSIDGHLGRSHVSIVQDGKRVRFPDLWRKSNCLRILWYDLQGNRSEECVPFVPEGTVALAVRGGKFLLANDARSELAPGASGIYWAADGAEKAVRVIEGIPPPQREKGDVSPDGCYAALPAAPDLKSVMRLHIFDVCSGDGVKK